MEISILKDMSRQVRRDVLRMIHAVQSGHPGGALGCADFFTVLYFRQMEGLHQCECGCMTFPKEGEGEDVFFLSNGHISAAWYSVLARRGYFPIDMLSTFRRMGSMLQGHPSPAKGVPGVRIASGSLGQGLSVACGMAMAKKASGDSHLVYTLHGDGEMQEGQIWEAAMFAAAKKIDNLIATVDVNNAQIDGPTNEVLSLGNLAQKFQAFGWKVIGVEGNDMEQLVRKLDDAKLLTGKGQPVAIMMHTQMGYGVDFMQDDYRWHGKPLNDEELKRALAQLPETQFGDYAEKSRD